MKTFLTTIVMLILWIPGVQAAFVSFDPLDSKLDVGDTVFIDIIGGDAFPETQGGGVNLFFDSDIVNVLSVSIDTLVWNFINDLGTIDNIAGEVSDILVSAINEPPATDPMGNFVVATIEFEVVSEGSTAIILTESLLNPWATFGDLVNPAFVNGSITTVPAPGAVWLFISGVLSLLLVRK